MDLRIEGSATPYPADYRRGYTPRNDSRACHINPITGLKMRTPRSEGGQETAIPLASSRPDSVPALDLKFLGKDVDTLPGPEISERGMPLNTSTSTVSWGTPTSASHRFSEQFVYAAPKHNNRRPVSHRQLATNEDIVPLDLLPPSARYQALYKQYESDIKQAYQNHHGKQTSMNTNAVVDVRIEPHNIIAIDAVETSVDHSEHETRGPTHDHLHQKKLDAEAVIDFKRKQKVIETIMIDQLSRAVISAPEQNDKDSITSHRSGMSRGANRSLHSSKVTTRSSATENLLMKRVRFGLRILSRNSVDAVKELTGFYFHVDQSLTIYEYRQFGKNAKALPFINRGRYSFICGPKSSQVYSLTHIYAGANLEFSPRDHQTLPKRLQDDEVLILRVTDVDDEEKRNILLSGVHPVNREKEYIHLHIPQNSHEIEERITLLNLQKYTRELLKTRGVKTSVGLWKDCAFMDRDNSGRLSRYDLEKLAVTYRIEPPHHLLETLLDTLDYTGSGYLNYCLFLHCFLGEMNEKRKTFVRRAFLKMDPSRSGIVTYCDVRKFFSAKAYPQVISGEISEADALQSFLETFQQIHKDHMTYLLFEAYYEGISIGMESNEMFIALLRNTWGI